MHALATDPRDVYVAGIMQRDIIKVAHTLTLDDVRTTISAASNGEVSAVFQGEEFLGLVSLTDIAEALAVIDYVTRQKTLQAV
jgi:CBS domain-containing protein